MINEFERSFRYIKYPVLLFFLILSFPHAPLLAGEPLVIPQGGIGVYELEIEPGDSAPWGSIRGELVQFHRLKGRRFQAYIGVDMEWSAGEYPLEIRLLKSGKSHIIKRTPVRVVDGKFTKQHLTLPERMVDLDEDEMRSDIRHA